MEISQETYEKMRDALLNMRMFDTPIAWRKMDGEYEEEARKSLRKAIDALASEDPYVLKFL